MTREEEIENAAIDYSEIEYNFMEYDDCGDVCDDRELIEKAFIQGAKWVDKTMIDKACEKLVSMLHMRDCGDYDCVASAYDTVEEFVEEFRKAMEE